VHLDAAHIRTLQIRGVITHSDLVSLTHPCLLQQNLEAIRPVVLALESLHNVALKRVKDMRGVCQDALDR